MAELRVDRIHNLANRTAAQMKKRLATTKPATIPEQEQLSQYQSRLEQGLEGFKDVVDAHGMMGLERYQSAMRRLAHKRGVQLEG